MSNPAFTDQDAQAVINLVASAPLANLTHAKQVDELIGRFRAFYEGTKPKEQTPARKPRQLRPAAPAGEAGTTEDVTA